MVPRTVIWFPVPSSSMIMGWFSTLNHKHVHLSWTEILDILSSTSKRPQYGPEQIIMHYAHVAASLNETPLSVTQKDNTPMTANNKKFPKKTTTAEYTTPAPSFTAIAKQD